MKFLRAKEFSLRPFKRGDGPSLIENINNRKIERNTLAIPYPYTMKAARFWIRHNLALARKKDRSQLHFAIDICGKVTGGMGLMRMNGHSAEIGYWLGENYWGKGIATKAVKLLTKYALADLGLRRVYARVFAFNKPSARVLEKSGYKYEGRLIKSEIKRGKPVDTLLYAKLR